MPQPIAKLKDFNVINIHANFLKKYRGKKGFGIKKEGLPPLFLRVLCCCLMLR
jgi:hypothetical protein